MITIGRALSRSGGRRHAAIAKSINVRTSGLVFSKTGAPVQHASRALSTQTRIPPAVEYEDNKVRHFLCIRNTIDLTINDVIPCTRPLRCNNVPIL
jgi:hypothetical protein